MLVISNWAPYKMQIDGHEVELRIKRMSVEEHIEFGGKARANAEPTMFRFISRNNTPEEQATDDKGKYKLTLAEIFERRFTEWSEDEREAFNRAVSEDELKAQEFLIYVFGNFVKVHAGLAEEKENGEHETVKEGLDMLRLFGARNDVLSEVVSAVRDENELSAEKKRSSRSDSASIVSSSAPGPDPGGTKLETIVENAEIADCVPLEDVTPAETGPANEK